MKSLSLSSRRPVRADDVAPALRATGRFSRELQLHLPTNSDRELIFLKYLSRDRISYSDDYSVLARESENLSCGDIEEICRMMILNAAKVAMEEKDLRAGEITVD